MKKFSIPALLLQLVTSLGLLSVASLVVDMMMQYVMPLRKWYAAYKVRQRSRWNNATAEMANLRVCTDALPSLFPFVYAQLAGTSDMPTPPDLHTSNAHLYLCLRPRLNLRLPIPRPFRTRSTNNRSISRMWTRTVRTSSRFSAIRPSTAMCNAIWRGCAAAPAAVRTIQVRFVTNSHFPTGLS